MQQAMLGHQIGLEESPKGQPHMSCWGWKPLGITCMARLQYLSSY